MVTAPPPGRPLPHVFPWRIVSLLVPPIAAFVTSSGSALALGAVGFGARVWRSTEGLEGVRQETARRGKRISVEPFDRSSSVQA